MTLKTITETEVEDAALEWLAGLGWNVIHGSDIAPGTTDADGRVALERFRHTLADLDLDPPLGHQPDEQ